MDCGVGESTETFYSLDEKSDTANFDCHICFELAQEPIVTLCGHLYCWLCLYQWLRLHSHSHECPLCKAILHDEQLIPIYGRGKTNCDPRSKTPAGVSIPCRPIAQRPQTAPRLEINYDQSDEPDPMSFVPMAVAKFGHMVLSTIFRTLPVIFNRFQMHRFLDAIAMCEATYGVPSLFPSSFLESYVHGFRDYRCWLFEGKAVAWKIVLAILGCLLLLHLIFARS